MGRVPDFIVKFDPKNDSSAELTRRILYHVFIRKRIKAKKPMYAFVGADSGEGKSLTVIEVMRILYEIQGLDLKDYFNDVQIYAPLEYPKKMQSLLDDKRLKKANFICFHEARELVKAKKWQDFLSQTVADVNAMSRSIKRMGIFIVSQFIRDITTDTRYTLNFYIKVYRPTGKPAQWRIYVLYKDDRDLEKPKLRKRKLWGYLMLPNGKWKKFIPDYIDIALPPADMVKEFETQDKAAKDFILRKKLEKLLEDMRKDLNLEGERVPKMISWYMKHDDNIPLIGKSGKRGFKLNKQFIEMHDLKPTEIDEFQKKLQSAIIKKQVGVEDYEKVDEDINAED